MQCAAWRRRFLREISIFCERFESSVKKTKSILQECIASVQDALLLHQNASGLTWNQLQVVEVSCARIEGFAPDHKLMRKRTIEFFMIADLADAAENPATIVEWLCESRRSMHNIWLQVRSSRSSALEVAPLRKNPRSCARLNS